MTKPSFLLSDDCCKVKTVSAVPIASLLSVGEPVCCSKHALRALVAFGGRVPPETAVLELFDTMCGYDGDWSVTGDLACGGELA